jgi:hypothetical protein
MSKGHVFLAQNSSIDYVRQAYALALSIKLNNPVYNQTCLITNDAVPEEYKYAFDYIVPIPWEELAKDSSWKIENRWKTIYASPFDENLVYDVDMLLLHSNDGWWDRLVNKDLCFTTNVLTYRGATVTNDFYRKTFTANNLCNVYTGCFYYKKSKRAFEFFKWLELIVTNYKQIYKDHLKKTPQKFCSIDVSAALALKFMDYESEASDPALTFIHMKSEIQGWKYSVPKWTSVLGNFLDLNINLNVGNFQQHGLFHYVEDEFLISDHVMLLESAYAKSR